MLLQLCHRPAHLEVVHLDDGGHQVEVVAGVAREQLQEGDVLRETAAPVAEPGAEVVRADTPVEAHAAGDVLDVGADQLADVGDLVDEADAGGQVGIGRELDHLGRGDVGADDLGIETVVKRHDRVAVLLVERPDHHPIGLHEVAHGRALGQELRARGVADAFEAPGVERGAHLLPRPDRDGALHHQHRRADVGRQIFDHRPHRREVGVSRRCRRGADAHEQELAAVDSLLHRQREAQAPAVRGDQLPETGLVERDAAGGELLDPLGRDVPDHHRVAELGQARAADEAGVAGAEERDPRHDYLAFRGFSPFAIAIIVSLVMLSRSELTTQ